MGLLLNVGCGGNRAPEPWINIDRSLGSPLREDGFRDFPCHPDVVADARDLPYENGSVSAIYAGCVLEHIEYDEIHVALEEFARVLEPGGKLAVVGPDMDRCVGEYEEIAHEVWPGRVLTPDDGAWVAWDGAAHLYPPTAANTFPLIAATFPTAVEVPAAELDDFWPMSVEHRRDSGWQFAILAQKEPHERQHRPSPGHTRGSVRQA